MPRGRKPKYPELQNKINLLIPLVFAQKKKNNLSQHDLIEGLINLPQPDNTLNIDEKEEIHIASGNYFSRAILSGVMQNNGPWRGYTFNDSLNLQKQNIDKGDSSEPKEIKQWESLLHFAATILLSDKFYARIKSLPRVSLRSNWTNPDMLMVRNSDLHRRIDDDLIKKISNTPEYILSSIELKYRLENRSSWLLALMETAINSGWGNESWLVFYQGDYEPESDIIEFAQKAGIGILEIIIAIEDQPDRRIEYLDVKTIIPARYNSSLSVNTISDRKALLEYCMDLIGEFEEEGSFRDIEQEEDKDWVAVIELLRQSSVNLNTQHGFSQLKSGFQTLEKLDPDNYSIFIKALHQKLIIINNIALLNEEEVQNIKDIQKRVEPFCNKMQHNHLILINEVVERLAP